MIAFFQQPGASSLQAAYRPIRYSISQTGAGATVPPAIEVSVRNGDNELERFPAGIDMLSGGTYTYFLDLGGTAAAYLNKLSGLPLPFTTAVRILPESIIALSAEVIEFAPGDNGLLLPTGNTIESNTCYVLDAYRRTDDASQTISSYGIFATPRFLTRRPGVASLPITAHDTMCVFNAPITGVVGGNQSLAIIFTFFDDAGDQVGIASITVSTQPGELAQFPTGPADLPAITWTEGSMPSITGISHYTVRTARRSVGVPDGDITFTPTAESRTVYISRAPCDPLVVHFYNSFGVWETVRFDESPTYQYALAGQSYQRPNTVLTVERSSRWSVQVASSAMTSAEASYLLDLSNSPVIYVQQGTRMVPVQLDASVLPVAFGPGSDGRQPFNVVLRATGTTQSQRAY